MNDNTTTSALTTPGYLPSCPMNDLQERPCVLIADDEEQVLKLLTHVVEQGGFRALQAHDGNSALGLLERQPVDLMLVDVKLPGPNGFEVLCKSKRRDPELPVVLITGQASIPDAIEAVKQGADNYLAKPFGANELLRAITQPLERRLSRKRTIAREGKAGQHVYGPEPDCPFCHTGFCRPSRKRGVEPLFFPFLLRPYRCMACYRRFWAWKIGRCLGKIGRAVFYIVFEHRWSK